MVTITIISILVAILVPTMVKIKRRSLATAISNDVRVFAAAFEAYAHEAGRWPNEVDAGVFPPEMASRINDGTWTRRSPIGGMYNWDSDQMHQGTRYKGVIAISSTASAPLTQDVDLWEAIDKVIDDGVLTSGNFRIGTDDEPIFIVAQ